MTTARYHPLRIGLALALTVAVMYTACAVAWVAWPEPALDFLNALFHGLDFRRLQLPERRFSFGTFAYPFIFLSAWGFVTGALFGAIANRLHGQVGR